MKNRHLTFTAVLFALACFGLLPTPKTLGVVPPPDGGYPGGNTAEGQSALLNLTTGGFNTAVGFLSLRSNTVGQFNTAVGAGTLLSNAADNNTAVGTGALAGNFDGVANSAFGLGALALNRTGSANTAIGEHALLSNVGGGLTGNFNTAVGSNALQGNTHGTNNTAIGHDAGNSVITASNVICIGHAGANVDNSCFIGNIRDAVVAPDAAQVVIDSAGKLGTTSGSSRRFKSDIKPMRDASEAVLALKPVTFHYKSDKTNTPQFGLIAEEVAAVNPDLVVRDDNGEIYTVRYEAVNAMLLNEFLKEHRTVQEHGATITRQRKDFEASIAQQQKQIEALTATVKEQAAQIQKVSAQLETSKFATGRIRRGGPAPKTVMNSPVKQPRH